MALRLLKKTISRIRSVDYQFLWEGKRGVSWTSVAQPKEKGGFGNSRLYDLDEVATIKEVTTLWENQGSVWLKWMNTRYIKRRALRKINTNQKDSSSWKSALARSSSIEKCDKLRRNQSLEWVGEGEGPSIKSIKKTL